MAKKITQKRVIDDDILGDAIKQGKELCNVIEKLEKKFKELLKVSDQQLAGKLPETSEQLKDFNVQLNTTEELTKKLNKLNETKLKIDEETVDLQKVKTDLDKQFVKAAERLVKANSERAKELQLVNEQTRRQNKLNKDAAREALGLVDTYERSAKRVRELARELKNLELEGRGNTKRAKELRREFNNLEPRVRAAEESVNQFQRSVGNYRNQALGATKATGGLILGLAALNKESLSLGNVGQAAEESSEDLRELAAQGEAVTNVIQNRLARAGTTFLEFAKNVSQSENPLRNWIVSLGNIQNITGRILAEKVVKDLASEIDDVTEAAQDAERAQIGLEKSQREQLERVAELNGVIAIQGVVAGDSTKSFNEQEVALRKVAAAEIERAMILRGIAQEELKIIQDRIKATDDEANRRALLDEQSEKTIALQEIQNELDQAQVTNQKEFTEVARDRFERELDFAIDAFDNQKTINERRIADERFTLEERQKLLNETDALNEKSFQNQIELVEGFTNERVDLAEISKLTDEEEIRRRLQLNELDDITLGRILEIIKERKLALADLDEARRDLEEEALERERRAAEVRKDIDVEVLRGRIDATSEAINEIQKDIEDANAEGIIVQTDRILELINLRFELQKAGLEKERDFELSNADLTAEERTLIQEKFNNELAKLERDRVDAVKDANDQVIEDDEETANKRLDIAKQNAKFIGDFVLDVIARNEDAQIRALDNVIKSQESAVGLQTELAKAGLSNTLAFERTELQQAEAAREARFKAQERRETILATLRLVAAFAERNPENAAGSAASEVAEAFALLKGIGAFATGVENLEGPGTETSDSILAWLSRGESVGTAKATRENPGLFTAVNKGEQHRDQWILQNWLPGYLKSHTNKMDLSEAQSRTELVAAFAPGQFTNLIGEFRKLNSTIRESKPRAKRSGSLDELVDELKTEVGKEVRRNNSRSRI